MISEISSVIFRLRGKGDAPDMIVLRKHNNRVFIAIVESDYPIDAVMSKVAGTVLDFVVRKHDTK